MSYLQKIKKYLDWRDIRIEEIMAGVGMGIFFFFAIGVIFWSLIQC